MALEELTRIRLTPLPLSHMKLLTATARTESKGSQKLSLACVASVPGRTKLNIGPQEGVFRIQATRKMGREQKSQRRAIGPPALLRFCSRLILCVA